MIADARSRAGSALSGWLDGRGDLRALVPLRMAIGPLVMLHLRPFLEDALAGRIYRDTFHVPYVAWYPELPRGVYVALLWATVGAAVLVSLGLATRAAAMVTATGVAYNLFLSETHFHHNRAFLLMLLIGVAVLPLGRWASLDRLVARRRGKASVTDAPLWGLALLRFEAAVAYWASGLSKLVDADWWGGRVTRLRVEQYGDTAAARGVPEWLLDLLSGPAVHWWFAKLVVLTELGIGLGLFWRRTRIAAIWLAVAFHVSIEATAEVQVFSLAGLAALVIWVTPGAGDRTLSIRTDRPSSRRFGTAVRLLDWTGRFRVVPSAGGTPIHLVDRPAADGSPVLRRGKGAVLAVLTRLPATFWFCAPLLLFTRRRPPTGPPGRDAGGGGPRRRTLRSPPAG